MDFKPPELMDRWMLEGSPHNAIVVSSRARLARNIPRVPFAPRANADQLHHVAEEVTRAFQGQPGLTGYERLDLANIPSHVRCFLRESHLISQELEKGGTGRLVFLSPTMDSSIMINEEDHLRLTTLVAGLRIKFAYDRLREIESQLEERLNFAFQGDFGYLTACPTNTGTGLRLSVMLHLPALSMTRQVEDTLAALRSYGLVVRGAYGEHSENIGNLFQISNEITLGKTELELMQFLEKVINQIIEREASAREVLWGEARDKIEDAVCRAVGVLSSARRMDSVEAVALLSRTRLGIGQDWGIELSHPELSRLFVDIQPAHLQLNRNAAESPEARDFERANYLRSVFCHPLEEGRNN